MSRSIPDAPWIRQTEATGRCSAENGAWWNYPDDEYEDEGGDDGDVYYGSETSDF